MRPITSNQPLPLAVGRVARFGGWRKPREIVLIIVTVSSSGRRLNADLQCVGAGFGSQTWLL
jgi:hypothetical protein